jgi:hypothetical protein
VRSQYSPSSSAHGALALFILASCAPRATPTKPAKKAPVEAAARPSGPRPEWIDKSAFVEESDTALHVYAVAACPIDEKDVCWKPPILLQTCRNRALSELAKAIGETQQTVADHALATTASATIDQAAVNRGWFDGDRTIYAVAEQLRAKDAALPTPLPRASFAGGSPLPRLEESLREGARASLRRRGICEDPHQRPRFPCCGGADTFCSDRSRFDAELPGGRCKCGAGTPCLYDFKCTERQGQKKCICQGAKCPCDVFNCKKGQTCGDGRCY